MCRWRAVTLAVVAVAGGCGGSATKAEPPRLSHALGVRLAAQAAAVEASLRANDSCAAVHRAAAFEKSVSAAIATGQVPAALRTPLASSARRLAAGIQCAPAPVVPKPDPPKPHKHHHHGHDAGPGDGGHG
jgi:hypothetical protein